MIEPRPVLVAAALLLASCGGRDPAATAAATPAVVAPPAAANTPVPATPPTTPAAARPAAEQPPAPRSRGGMALGPALVLVQGIQPGTPTGSGIAYRVENRGSIPLQVTLAALPPELAGTPTWELGYEALPDRSWLSVIPETLILAPATQAEVLLRWKLPEDRALLNRRFVGCLFMRQGGPSAVGAGLALAARVQFETASDSSADAGAAAALATVPSLIAVELAPGTTAQRSVLLRRNGASVDEELTWISLEGVETDAERRMRYATPGTTPAAIATPAEGRLERHGDAWVPLTLNLQAPADAVPGTRLEHILVIGAPDQLSIAKTADRRTQPLVALLRCVVNIIPSPGP